MRAWLACALHAARDAWRAVGRYVDARRRELIHMETLRHAGDREVRDAGVHRMRAEGEARACLRRLAGRRDEAAT